MPASDALDRFGMKPQPLIGERQDLAHSHVSPHLGGDVSGAQSAVNAGDLLHQAVHSRVVNVPFLFYACP